MNSGIIEKSEYSKDKYKEEEIAEQLKLVYSEYQMSQFTTPIDIEAKLQEIFGEENVSNVSLTGGKLTATIYGKVYQYNVSTGKAGEYVDPVNYGTGKTKATVVAGDDISIGTERFKVISNTNGTIVAMPYYNLVLDSNPIKQATADTASSAGTSTFSTTNYWTQGDDAIDMSDSRNNIQQYITAYKTTLEGLGAEGITVRAAKYSELNASGVTAAMRNPGQTGRFWLGSGYSDYDYYVWGVGSGGSISNYGYSDGHGVRPVIVIS